MTDREYGHDVSFIEAAFRACWRNSDELVRGSKLLLDAGLHAQALALAVLALEELGKLFCADGLLYARLDDERARQFAESLKRHSVKLSALTLFPLLLGQIASVDPRYGKEKRFAQALAIGITDLKNRGNAVFALLSENSFQDLNALKQRGFYAEPKSGVFSAPSDSIEPQLADAIYNLAWRASSTLDFLLKGGNLERYMEGARKIRKALSEEQHRFIEARAKELATDLFSEHDENR